MVNVDTHDWYRVACKLQTSPLLPFHLNRWSKKKEAAGRCCFSPACMTAAQGWTHAVNTVSQCVFLWVCGRSSLSGCPCSMQQRLTWHRGYLAVPGGRTHRWWTLHNCSSESNWRRCGPWSLYSGWVPGVFISNTTYCQVWKVNSLKLTDTAEKVSLCFPTRPLKPPRVTLFIATYVYSCLTFFLPRTWSR